MRASTTTDLANAGLDYSVSNETLDNAFTGDTTWKNTDFTKWLGYYKQIPELHQAINSLAIWTAGKGWKTDDPTKALLERLTGWGEDTFQSIMENMLIMKKVNGDAYALIVRAESGTIINLKPLSPDRVKTIVDSQGIIKGYEYLSGDKSIVEKKLEPKDVFHITNDRIGDEIHGTSVVESCEWVILARNEAMSDWRRISHRSTIRVLYIDMDDVSTLTSLKTQYKDAIKNGELLVLPAKKSEAELQDISAPPIQTFTEWIRYLENFFYQAVGIPKIILGGSQEFTEASSKIGYLTFEQVYMREQRELEGDLLAQLGIEVEFERPISLKDDVQTSEAANTGQVGVQPNDTQAGVGE